MLVCRDRILPFSHTNRQTATSSKAQTPVEVEVEVERRTSGRDGSEPGHVMATWHWPGSPPLVCSILSHLARPMARTTQKARKSTGGQAPRRALSGAQRHPPARSLRSQRSPASVPSEATLSTDSHTAIIPGPKLANPSPGPDTLKGVEMTPEAVQVCFYVFFCPTLSVSEFYSDAGLVRPLPKRRGLYHLSLLQRCHLCLPSRLWLTPCQRLGEALLPVPPLPQSQKANPQEQSTL